MFFFLRLAKIKEWVDAHDPGAMVIPVSGCVEAKLFDMDEEERAKYCEENKTQRWDINTTCSMDIVNCFLELLHHGFSVCFQCSDQNNKDRLCSTAAGILLYCRTR